MTASKLRRWCLRTRRHQGGPAFTHISYDDFRISPRQSPRKEERLDYQSSGALYGLYRSAIGRVRLTEREARAQKRNIRVAKVADDFCRTGPGGDETRGFMKAIVEWRNEPDLGRCDPRHRGWRNYVCARDCNDGQVAVYRVARWHLCAPNSDGITEQTCSWQWTAVNDSGTEGLLPGAMKSSLPSLD